MTTDPSARGGARRGLRRRAGRRSLSSLPYLPGLDGMRALAVIAVMVYHANHDWLPGGFLGVEVFFVISGYLITLLLIGEHERTGRVSLRQFWARRARRLLPALFFMLLLVITYTWIFEREQLGQLRGDVFAGLGYVSNWYQIWVGQGYTAASAFAPLRHLWSLAVEEQFYLLWPIVMAVLIRWRGHRSLPGLSRWLLLAAVAITVAVGLLFQPGRELAANGSPIPDAFWTVGDRAVSKTDTLYLSSITRSTGLLIGGAFALIWRPRAVMRSPLRSKGLVLDLLAIIGLASLGAFTWLIHLVSPGGADPMLFRGGFLAVGFATVLVMAAVTHRATWTGSILGNPLLHWIGTRSYGLYLYHWPIYQAIRKAAGNPLTLVEFAAAMAATAVITEFSYRVIEMPIRRRELPAWLVRIRHRRAPVRRLIVAYGTVACLALFGFAGANMATAELTLSDQELAQQAGQDVVVDFGAAAAGAPGAPGAAGAPGVAGGSTTDPPASTEAASSTAVESTAAETTAVESTAAETTAIESTAVESTAVETTETETTAAETTEVADSSGPASTTDSVDSAGPDDAPRTTERRTDKELESGALQIAAAPSTTDPPETDPPATDPPETDPPETDPPETDPPTTTSPPTTRPTATVASTTVTTVTTTTSAPVVTTVAPTAPPTAPPVTTPPAPVPSTSAGPQVFQAIGDSVMLGAAVNLGERGVAVDAAVSRQMIDFVPVVQGMAAADTLGTTVIVHLGTNGRFSEETMHAFFDALAGADHVIVLTVHADRGWTAHNNELIMTLPARYSNITIIDWNTLVESCPGNCLYDDGIHLPPAGRRYYAQLIFDVAGL